MKRDVAVEPNAQGAEDTGLPLLHSWKAVYLFVLASFVLWVALLLALTKFYS